MSLLDILKPRSTGTGTTVAVGLLSAAAAAGLTYFIFETQTGSRERKRVMRWAKDMKREAIGETNELTEVSKEIYDDMKSMLKDKASILANVEKDEVAALADRIRNHWEEIREDIEDTVDKVAKDSKETMAS